MKIFSYYALNVIEYLGKNQTHLFSSSTFFSDLVLRKSTPSEPHTKRRQKIFWLFNTLWELHALMVYLASELAILLF